MNAILADSVAGFGRDLERRNIATKLSLEDDLPLVRGEAALLGQMVASLIANASEAMPGGGEIKLVSRREPGWVVAEVADNGPGIARDTLQSIFKPFYTTKQRGLGLGLPLVRRVLERLGGRVEVFSAPGQGTRVCLMLREEK
jgi:signal transduction histidine kinase